MFRTAASTKVMWAGRARTLAFCLLAVLVAASIGVLLTAKDAHAKTFTVNSTGDGSDFALEGNCDASPTISVVCTLRAAIQEANDDIRNPGLDTINFNIPTTDPNCNANTGVCTISPASALPTITEAVSINGYTQRPCSPINPAPCSRPNTGAPGTNAVLLIQLNGTIVTSGIGLEIEASNSLVKGLVINRFGAGIAVNRTASTNSTGNRIEGNFIGTNAAGTADLGNLFQGVFISGSNNTVGGTSRAARNLTSGNGANGVVTTNGSGNQVLGNLIGTDRTGTEDLGNDGAGVLLSFPNQTVGGDTSAGANIIAFNGQAGVAVVNSFSTGNGILRNSIFSNGGLGIDLGDDGRTANDPGDADTGTGGLGGNNFQNFPILNSAETAGATTIKGRLNSTRSTQFVVRFFANPSNDNEGKRFLGQTNVTTDASGNTGTFTFSPANAVAPGQRITATATDPGANTSEFSAVREVTAS
jgi:CSLREA domain-containing protein